MVGQNWIMDDGANRWLGVVEAVEFPNLVTLRDGLSDAEFAEVRQAQFPGVGLGDGHHGRRIPDLSELMRDESARLAGLRKVEVLAIVLYTGPMVRKRLLAS